MPHDPDAHRGKVLAPEAYKQQFLIFRL